MRSNSYGVRVHHGCACIMARGRRNVGSVFNMLTALHTLSVKSPHSHALLPGACALEGRQRVSNGGGQPRARAAATDLFTPVLCKAYR